MASVTRTRYRIEREKLWQELSELIGRVEAKGWRRTPAEDLERLAALYRRAATHLAQIRGLPSERRTAAALNDLVVRAHSQIYRPNLVAWPRRVAEFLLIGFPRTFRDTLRLQALAWSFLVLGFVLGWILTLRDPDLYYAVVPAQESRSPGATVAALEESLQFGRDLGTGSRSAFSGMLWQHNARVALLVFSCGVLAGIPTLLLLLFNGLMLGAMTAVFHQAGLGTAWWAWILGHGVTELWAVVLAGTAGLVLGRAVVRPGRLSRRRALVEAAQPAFRLVLGAVPMLLIAALLEGFFRQSEAGTATRFAVAALTGVLWLCYFFLPALLPARRRTAQSTPEPRSSR